MLSRRAHENVDMLHGPIAPAIVRFAVPLILANLLQMAFNAADIIVLGQFAGDDAVAAVTSTTSLISLLLNFTSGFSLGVNVTAARALGEGNGDRVKRTVHTGVTLALLCGAFLLIAGIAGAGTLLRWMGSPTDVRDLSALYLRIYMIGAPGTMLYNFGAALLRSNGDTRRPLRFLSVAGVLNASLNLFFVAVLHWDVAGVAAATAVSKWASGLLVLWALLHENGVLHLDLRRLRLDGEVAGEILRVGLPAGLQSSLASLSQVIIQSGVNSLGKQFMAGSGATANLCTFIYYFINGFVQASVTFTSQNLGARQLDRVDRVRRWCLLFAVSVGLAVSLLIYAFARPLLGIYVDGEEAIQAGLLRMRVAMLPYAMLGFLDVLIGIQRAMGKSVPPMLMSLLGTCGFRILWIYTVFRAHPTGTVLFLSYPVAWTLTTAALTVSYIRVRKKVFARVRSELAAEAGT